MHLDEMPVACMRSLMPCGSSSSAVIAEGLCPWQVGLMAVGPTSQPLSSSAVTVEEAHHGVLRAELPNPSHMYRT